MDGFSPRNIEFVDDFTTEVPQCTAIQRHTIYLEKFIHNFMSNVFKMYLKCDFTMFTLEGVAIKYLISKLGTAVEYCVIYMC